MRRFTSVVFGVILSLMVMLPFGGTVSAQDSPIRITLMSAQERYEQGYPIQLQIRVFNDNWNPDTGLNDPVITREGFFAQDFHLRVTFIDPDGKPIKYKFETVDPEPGPAYRLEGRDVAFAEIIPPDGDNPYVLTNAKDYYDLLTPGWYTARVLVPFEAFSEYLTTPAGEILAYLDDPNKKVFNPLASNEIHFEIYEQEHLVKSAIEATVDLIAVERNSKPVRTYLQNAEVRIFKVSDILAKGYEANFKYYPTIWLYVPPIRSALTGAGGLCRFPDVPQDDYLILVQHRITTDFKHLAATVSSADGGWFSEAPIVCYMRSMQRVGGKKVAGKTSRLTGSELLITEPEYIEWDGTEEIYPFILESKGNWEVTTSVTPPDGFSVDNKSLSAKVKDETKVMLFTIKEGGENWKETKVKYKIKHKKITKTLESKIGIKLSKKLAKKKNKGIYGDTEIPGPFEGGKIVQAEDGQKEKEKGNKK
jgi:hypothetical protein